MKSKLILLLIAIAIANVSTFAQHKIKPGILIGFDGYNETGAVKGSVHGIVAGAIFDISFSKIIGCVPSAESGQLCSVK